MNVRKTRFTNKRLVTSWVTINLIRRQWWIFMHFKPFFLSPKRIPIEENDQQNNNNNKNSCFFPVSGNKKKIKESYNFSLFRFVSIVFCCLFWLFSSLLLFFLFKLQLFWPFTWMIAVAFTSGYGGKAQRKKEGKTGREREGAACCWFPYTEQTLRNCCGQNNNYKSATVDIGAATMDFYGHFNGWWSVIGPFGYSTVWMVS